MELRERLPSRRARVLQVEDEDLETQAIPAKVHRERRLIRIDWLEVVFFSIRLESYIVSKSKG